MKRELHVCKKRNPKPFSEWSALLLLKVQLYGIVLICSLLSVFLYKMCMLMDESPTVDQIYWSTGMFLSHSKLAVRVCGSISLLAL